jgi:hypothetical protein
VQAGRTDLPDEEGTKPCLRAAPIGTALRALLGSNQGTPHPGGADRCAPRPTSDFYALRNSIAHRHRVRSRTELARNAMLDSRPLMKIVREIRDLPKAPEGTFGCADCAALDELMIISARRN